MFFLMRSLYFKSTTTVHLGTGNASIEKLGIDLHVRKMADGYYVISKPNHTSIFHFYSIK